MIGLLISACNLLYDNTQQKMEQRCYVNGVGAPDGELDLFELYTFLSVLSIMAALALRIYVNTAADYPEIIVELSSNNSAGSLPPCLELSFSAAILTKIGQLACISGIGRRGFTWRRVHADKIAGQN